MVIAMALSATPGLSITDTSQTYGQWPMFGGDAQHNSIGSSNLDENPGMIRWTTLSQSYNIGWVSSVIGNNGTVYAANGRSLVAISSKGEVKWDLRIRGDQSFTPALGYSGNVHVGSRSGIVTISPSGKFVWNFTTDTPIVCPPTVGNDWRVYFSQDYGPSELQYYLYCVLPNGTLGWKYNLGPSGLSSPAIGYDGMIYAVGGINSTFGSASRIVAIRPNGTLDWSKLINSSVESSPVVTNDTIYVGGDDHFFYAFDMDGGLRWKFEAADSIKTTAAVALDGTIYFGSSDGYLYSLSGNGSLRWKIHVGILDYSHPVVGTGGTVLFGTQDSLTALFPNGTVKWSVEIGTDVYSPAIGEDGTVYVGTYNKGLFAIGNEYTANVELFVIGIAFVVIFLLAVIFVVFKTRRH
jgi:outer membrane protein assembly factor BamB